MNTQNTTITASEAPEASQSYGPKIIVHVEGGLIHSISGIPPHLLVEVRDYDTDGIDPERLTDTPDGEAAITLWDSEGFIQ